MHPERLLAAAPCGGNYIGRCVTNFSRNSGRATLPIRGFEGEKDAYGEGLDRQWQDARRIAEAHGYKNLSRVIVAGKGHEPFPDEVLTYFNSLLNR